MHNCIDPDGYHWEFVIFGRDNRNFTFPIFSESEKQALIYKLDNIYANMIPTPGRFRVVLNICEHQQMEINIANEEIMGHAVSKHSNSRLTGPTLIEVPMGPEQFN